MSRNAKILVLLYTHEGLEEIMFKPQTSSSYIEIIKYHIRAINHFGFYSKIIILSLELPHKRGIRGGGT